MALLARRDRAVGATGPSPHTSSCCSASRSSTTRVTFTAEKQTVFGWFENDVYVGLLVTAFVLQVLRLRGVSLVTRR